MTQVLDQEILSIVLRQPGTSAESLCRIFELTAYRLSRVFRRIQRELVGRTLVRSEEHGVWIIPYDASRCDGVEWVGASCGGYRQCWRDPAFADRRCFDHSRCESQDMTAFKRNLSYLAGPAEPSAYNLSQLATGILTHIMEDLDGMVPLTRKEHADKARLLGMLRAALAIRKWKERRRPRSSGQEVPPEFAERLRRSSGNLFEYSLRKFFLLFEIPVDSDREQVLKAWRRLARRYHPDLESGDEDMMKAVNTAKDRIFRIRGWE